MNNVFYAISCHIWYHPHQVIATKHTSNGVGNARGAKSIAPKAKRIKVLMREPKSTHSLGEAAVSDVSVGKRLLNPEENRGNFWKMDVVFFCW